VRNSVPKFFAGFAADHGIRILFPNEAAMSEIVRFSVSVESDLLEQFDRYCQQEQIATRSEAVRQLIHDTLTRRAWESGSQTVAGTLTLVYDHHRGQLGDRLMELQHDNTDLIVSTMHAHLTHEICMEVIMLRGPADRLKQISAQLRGMKGIFKGELVMAAADQLQSGHHHP
jgi:CopG family nickel-responsive transcriptional regulator